jgi:hypothetical protein
VQERGELEVRKRRILEMRITLSADGPKTLQVYNLYNNPRMRS